MLDLILMECQSPEVTSSLQGMVQTEEKESHLQVEISSDQPTKALFVYKTNQQYENETQTYYSSIKQAQIHKKHAMVDLSWILI